MNEVGELIYNRRKALGLTLEEVGNAVGVSKSTVKKWESGYISNMRKDKIEKLAKVLEISPVRLLGIKTKTYAQDDIKSTMPNSNLVVDGAELLNYYNKLNDTGKKEAVKRVKELTILPDYKK